MAGRCTPPLERDNVGVLPDEALDAERDAKVHEWKTQAKRSLIFLVVGRGGMGKSSLINNLLELDRSCEEGAQEGCTGKATTQAVRKHTGSKHDIQVIAYDTPALQDPSIREEDVIAELVRKTGSKVISAELRQIGRANV